MTFIRDRAFDKIKATAVYRKAEGIDGILVTDAHKFEKYFEQGKEEVQIISL